MKKNVLNFAALLLLVFSLVGCKNESPSLEVQAEPEVVTSFKPSVAETEEQSEFNVVLDGDISIKLNHANKEGFVRVVDKRHPTSWDITKRSGGLDFPFSTGPLTINGLRQCEYILFVFDEKGNLISESILDLSMLDKGKQVLEQAL